MSTYQPFIYLIGWSKLDRWYIGARYAKRTTPADLWTKYFTSSRNVTAMRYVHGEPDVIRTFPVADKDDALNQELGVIIALDAVRSSRYLNRCCNGTVWNPPVTFKLSAQAKAKISRAHIGLRQTRESIAKIKAWKAANPKPSPNKGKVTSEAAKQKRLNTMRANGNLGEGSRGPLSESRKAKIGGKNSEHWSTRTPEYKTARALHCLACKEAKRARLPKPVWVDPTLG